MPLVNTRGAASAQALGYAARSTDAAYIEDVFSTYLYTGNSSTQTITTGIDLSTKSGLVWLKARNSALDHQLYDTARGAGQVLYSNLTSAQSAVGTGLTAFSSTGFTLGSGNVNTSTVTYTSWTFRKQAKFFDVVTYTGNGAGSARAIPHSLGSVPGCIIVKYYSGTAPGGSDWYVYHRGLTTPATQFLRLSGTGGQATTTIWGSTSPTATDFYVNTTTLNQNGTNYVAYVFAHDAGGFGASGTDNAISCGSFTTNGSGAATVTLGYEPQWVLYKQSNTSGDDWKILDVMRGWDLGTSDKMLFPNLTAAEAGGNRGNPQATGFSVTESASATYVYIAIRRGPMRTPTSGTSVFTPVAYTGDGNADRQISTTISPDLSIVKARTNNTVPMWADRLRGTAVIYSSATAAEVNPTTGLSGGGQIVDTGVQAGIKILQGTTNVNNVNQSTITYVDWNFKRAPGFFDTVCYEGNSTSARAVSHNLGASPELVIVKVRNDLANWPVYSSALGNNKTLYANLDNASATSGIWGNTTATASAFYVGVAGDYGINNATGFNYVAYLFGSVAGVSKVGSYTGSGTTKQIDCGFTGGARFVLIKRTDSTGDWYVWDTARGIIAANDPYLFLNSTALEVTSTDYIDTYSAGFEISSTAPAAINANGGTFIFLAIA